MCVYVCVCGGEAQVSPSGSFIHHILQMYLSRYNIWTLGQMSSDVRNAGQRSLGRHKPPSTFVSLRLSPQHAPLSFLSVDVISCSAAYTGNLKCRCLCQRQKRNCFFFWGPILHVFTGRKAKQWRSLLGFCQTL